MPRLFLLVIGLCTYTATWPCVTARAEESPGQLGPIVAPGRSGAEIYRRQCAACHGPQGEGNVKHYGKPLVGDRSLDELAALIAETMPEDDPGTCVGDDARAVAGYIYGAFYSPVAQARNQPARIELSRLTVRQYRQTIADLVAGFRASPPPQDERQGLRGQYFASKGNSFGRAFDRSSLKLERIDAAVDFNFGEESPAEGIDRTQFALRWEGSVIAPVSGEYEFILATESGARLWVNDNAKPLIDGMVRSGDRDDLRATIHLLGGRAYALRLDAFKEPKQKAAHITLKWRIEGREPEVVPERYLSPAGAASTLVVETPFPPDDMSVGYERGTSISAAWEQATTDAAIEVANYVVANLDELADARGGKRSRRLDRERAAREFCANFASRAMRRPLTGAQIQLYVDRRFEEAPDIATAVKRVVLLVLKSPRFLYHQVEHDAPDAIDVASRLSYGLWDSLPDETLLTAAEEGELATPETIRRQAARMVDDLRTRGKVHDFFEQWLRIDRFEDIAKDSKRFPEFDALAVSDLRTALELFLDNLVWSDTSDFRQLLLSDSLYLNGRLAALLKVDLPSGLAEDAPFELVHLPAGERAGVLTHPLLMAGYAYTQASSPIHRGVFVARSVLGRSLRPPPEAVAPLPLELHAELTTRERVDLQTQGESCQSCHRMINPLGFAFEHYDAIGRYRKKEKGRPIDATGSYLSRSGELIQFADVRELAAYLAASRETHEAFVEQLFHYLVKQPIRAYGQETARRLCESFVAGDFNMRKLMVEIMVASALVPRQPADKAVAAANTSAPATRDVRDTN